MLDRFFHPEIWQEVVTLDNAEAHHLSRVMRKQVGDEVELFNGRGNSAIAQVQTISKREVTLNVLSNQEEPRDLSPLITLAVAPPKGDRLRWLIEKATEIGVSKFIPLKTKRSVVEPGNSKLDKLEQTVIAACKQCRRNTLMQIETSCSLDELFEKLSSDQTKLLIGSPTGLPLPAVFNSIPNPQEFCLLIGPEGGFSPEEEQIFLERNITGVCLGSYILRVETAAISLASSLRSLIEARSVDPF